MMGQDVLQPPSVKGWDPGMAWLNSTTLMARYRFAAELGREDELGENIEWEMLEEAGPRSLLRRFYPEGLEDGVEDDLLEAAADDIHALAAACLQLPEAQYV